MTEILDTTDKSQNWELSPEQVMEEIEIEIATTPFDFDPFDPNKITEEYTPNSTLTVPPPRNLRLVFLAFPCINKPGSGKYCQPIFHHVTSWVCNVVL